MNITLLNFSASGWCLQQNLPNHDSLMKSGWLKICVYILTPFSFFFFFNFGLKIHHMKFAIFIIFLSVQYNSVKYIHVSIHSISRTPSILQNWDSLPIEQLTILPTTILPSGSLSLTTLGTSYKKTVFYFWDWLIPQSIMSRFIHFVTRVSISFLFKVE